MRATAPVVLVIFDEFPVHSLMGADGRIDKRLYPNFARLAADATWYRNTASVDQDTPYAVPAILDGRLPRQERLPVAADHPQNIFSLFGSRYELHVREDAHGAVRADGCARPPPREGNVPDALAVGRRRATPTRTSCSRSEVERSRGAGHRTTAIADTRLVPRETQAPSLRAAARQPRPRPPGALRGVRGRHRGRPAAAPAPDPHPAAARAVPVPALGARSTAARRRRRSPAWTGGPATAAEFVVEQAYQRHLLQVQATDRLLGELLDRLHEVGIYDRAVVAVVADHGMSFRLGHDRRLVRPGNIAGHRAGALLPEGAGPAARPRSATGRCRRSTCCPRSRTCSAWRSRGRSTAARRCARPAAPARDHRQEVQAHLPRGHAGLRAAKRAALARKVRLFGGDIYAFGPRPDLIGDTAPPGGHTVDGGPRERLRPGARGGRGSRTASAAAVARWPWP